MAQSCAGGACALLGKADTSMPKTHIFTCRCQWCWHQIQMECALVRGRFALNNEGGMIGWVEGKDGQIRPTRALVNTISYTHSRAQSAITRQCRLAPAIKQVQIQIAHWTG